MVTSGMHRIVRGMRDEDWAKAKVTPPTINGLITMLDKVEDKGKTVWVFDDLMLNGQFYSYRGYYDQLAISYEFGVWDKDAISVVELIKKLEAAKGQEFEGYKGGDFMMFGSTSIWLANYSHSPGAIITGYVEDYGRIYLQTVMNLEL